MLTEKHRRILGQMQLSAELPLSEIARRCRYREHTVRYAIDYFLERQIIRRSALIDLMPIGYSRYNLFFSLDPVPIAEKKRLLKELVEDERVIFVAELGGDFQYEVSFVARGVHDLSSLLETICRTPVYNKSLVITLSKTMFGSKFLCPKNPSPSCSFGTQGGLPESHIDEVDHIILRGLANLKYDSLSHLARQLALPISTLQYRMRGLERKRIIVGYYYILEPSLFGMLRFKVLLFTKAVSAPVRKEIFAFCRRHQNVDILLGCAGAHEYELVVQAEDYKQALKLEEELAAAFSANLQAVKIFPTLQVHKFSDYPLLSPPAGARTADTAKTREAEEV